MILRTLLLHVAPPLASAAATLSARLPASICASRGQKKIAIPMPRSMTMHTSAALTSLGGPLCASPSARAPPTPLLSPMALLGTAFPSWALPALASGISPFPPRAPPYACMIACTVSLPITTTIAVPVGGDVPDTSARTPSILDSTRLVP